MVVNPALICNLVLIIWNLVLIVMTGPEPRKTSLWNPILHLLGALVSNQPSFALSRQHIYTYTHETVKIDWFVYT